MTLYLMGGGPTPAVDPIINDFCTSSIKRGTRIAIAILGREDEAAGLLPDYADPIRRHLPEAEIEPIWLPDADEGPACWPDDPEQIAGLVVAAGWTPGYLEALMPHRRVIASHVHRGYPYLGWSAGAMVVGRHAIVGGWRHQGRRVAPEIAGEGSVDLDIREGLGLIGPAIETHASEQFLVNRAMAALESGPMQTIACIDEDTALIINANSGRTKVKGLGRVTWVRRNTESFTISYETQAV